MGYEEDEGNDQLAKEGVDEPVVEEADLEDLEDLVAEDAPVDNQVKYTGGPIPRK